jgi:hypothetical protein
MGGGLDPPPVGRGNFMDNFWTLIGSIAFALVVLGIAERVWESMHEEAH